MATVSVATQSDATSSGWSFNGSGDNWWAEKRCQLEGKFLAVAATSSALLTSIQQVENHHGRLGANSPEFDKNAGTFKGHI